MSCPPTRRRRGSGTPAESSPRDSGADRGARTPFGSLPFATSLPHYSGAGGSGGRGGVDGSGGAGGSGHIGITKQSSGGSATHKARQSSGGGSGGHGGGTGRPSPVASPLGASPAGPPNAMLASVMRAAGEEPAPLPWARLPPAPPPMADDDEEGAGGRDDMSNGGGGAPGVVAPVATQEPASAAAGSVVAGATGDLVAAGAVEGDSGGEELEDDDAPDLDDVLADQAEEEMRESMIMQLQTGVDFLSVNEGA